MVVGILDAELNYSLGRSLVKQDVLVQQIFREHKIVKIPRIVVACSIGEDQGGCVYFLRVKGVEEGIRGCDEYTWIQRGTWNYAQTFNFWL